MISLPAAVILATALAGQTHGETRLSETSIGPFTVVDKRIAFEAHPYPVDKKVTSLSWEAPSGMFRDLTDDGHSYQVSHRIGRAPKECLANGRLRLSAASEDIFGSKALLPEQIRGCISDEQRKMVSQEIDQAQTMFRAAHAEFLRHARATHGESDRRCVEFEFGNHGPICAKYSDEN